jgi:Gluconate 2-dehydrogenase subunit 3
MSRAMNRREAIRQAGLMAGAAALWASLPQRTWAALPIPTGWNEAEEALLTLIGDTIIPATASSPGAGAVGIGRFIIVQTTQCFPVGSSDALRRGMQEIQAASRQEYSEGFAGLSAEQRETVLVGYEARATASWRLIKELTLLGYFTSERGATQALRYLPVPGGYRGSLPLSKGDRSWAL